MPTRRRSGGSRKAAQRVRMAVGAALALETGGLWVGSHRLGGRVVVRCRQDHLFTTIWIPGASVKSLRLGWWRVQRCPVGHHFSVVSPVRESDLSGEELQAARAHHDIPVP